TLGSSFCRFSVFSFVFHSTRSAVSYTLSLHDALPIYDFAQQVGGDLGVDHRGVEFLVAEQRLDDADVDLLLEQVGREAVAKRVRSEEHTSELQSRENLVCRLLLEKKK